MALKAMMLVVALVLLQAAADNQTLDGCQRDCGGVPIPYPFGVGTTTGKNCFLEESFELTCDDSTLFWGNIPVTAINITQGQVDMMVFISRVCYNSSLGNLWTSGNRPRLRSAAGFTISSEENKFISVGCDTYGYLNSFYNGSQYSTGCSTQCYNNSMEIVDGNCSGIGCCQVDIPPRMRNILLVTGSFQNFNRSFSFNNCSYSFVVKNGNYTFSKSHLEYYLMRGCLWSLIGLLEMKHVKLLRTEASMLAREIAVVRTQTLDMVTDADAGKVMKETRTIPMVAQVRN